MTDDALRWRLDVALLLLAANLLLLFGVAAEIAPHAAVGTVVLSVLVGYGLLRRDRIEG